jgi:O-antigen/teichoic acid export membrane protein
MTIRGVLLGLERFSDESLVVISDRVLTLAAVAASLWTGAGLVGVCVAFVVARTISVAVGFVLTHRQVGPPKPAFERDIWRDLQVNALPFGAFVVVLNVYNYIDTIFLGTMRGVGETGLYGQAYQIYQGLTYAPAILASVLIPRLSHLWSVDRAAHARVLRQCLAGTVLLALALGGAVWLLAPLLLTSAFGSDAVAAASALRILASGLVFIYAIWILHAAAISVFGQQLMLRTTIIGVIANTAMNLWWIPRYGRDGAAWATVGGEALTLALLAIGLRHVWTKNAGRGVTSAGV